MARREAISCFLFLMTAIVVLAGCDQSDNTYTLYRSSSVIEDARAHVATFDAYYKDKGYNQGNCFIARDLFTNQPGVTVRNWCEKGRYKP